MRNRALRLGLVALTALLGMAAHALAETPPAVVPVSYALELFPDAANLTFRGLVRIVVDVATATPRIVLNADALQFDRVSLDDQRSGKVTLDPAGQTAAMAFDTPVAAGRHTLLIDYRGVIDRGTKGFFAMDYATSAGPRRMLATNFEPASERRFMPSWDEPAHKAAFTLTVDAPAEQMAVSNMPIAKETALGGGRKRVRFQTSPPMSSYLYFLALGDLERVAVKSNGVTLGVVAVRGQTAQAGFALASAKEALPYFNAYFGVDYPLPKLDLIAAPGDISAGAMENWGAILASQQYLLLEPDATREDRQSVYDAVAHEMSHQWFGDLVTMQWWDALWLNEGFASWMSIKTRDELHPEWKPYVTEMPTQKERGFRLDARATSHPVVQPVAGVAQAVQAFDDITYKKGQSVIRMMEAYVGKDAFRAGVRRYMRDHAYGNTQTADFWNAVQAETTLPVTEVVDAFLYRPGVPLITVSQRAAGGRTLVTLTQSRFSETPEPGQDSPWRVPLTLRAVGADAVTTVLTKGATSRQIEVASPGPVIVNAGQTAYARVLYDPATLAAVGAAFERVSAVDQIGLLSDTWALGQSGYLPATGYLELSEHLPLDADPAAWKQVIGALTAIDRLYGRDPAGEPFRAYARGVLQPLYGRLGWTPGRGEAEDVSALRTALLIALGRFDDPTVIAQARTRFDALAKDGAAMPPSIRDAVLPIVAAHADAHAFDAYLRLIKASPRPLEQARLVRALASVSSPPLIARYLAFTVSPEAPLGAYLDLIRLVAKDHPDEAWAFMTADLDRPDNPLSVEDRLKLVPEIAALSADPARIDALQSYADRNIPADARRPVADAVTAIRFKAGVKARQLPEITRWAQARR
jgi:aminopeptidase N